jgi:branched-chain amino acid transport system substrate-binding protein
MPARTERRSRRGAFGRPGIVVTAMTVVMAVAIAACTGDDDAGGPTTTVAIQPTTTQAARTGDGVLSIGVFLPRTGPGAQLGEPMIAAVEQAVELINEAGGVLGDDVVIEVVDEGGGTGPEELMVAGVDAIIGPASSNVALSQFRATVEQGRGVVSCSPTATALALDRFPDNGFFFRTAPSDSLQMVAIAREAERTGRSTVAIGYLDDPYGRALADTLVDEIESRNRLEVLAEVGFSGDEEDLSGKAAALLGESPGAVIVLGDADDGSRLLAALDTGDDGVTPSQFIVNDAIRSARQIIQNLSSSFRLRLTGIAPLAVTPTAVEPEGFFTAHATDCVNLIALAAVQAESDTPNRIRANMASVSTGGRVCNDFARCSERLAEGLQIDYNGASGSVDLSSTTGDPVRAWFEAFGFDDEGVEDATRSRRIEIP